MSRYIERVLECVIARNPGETEFHQVVESVIQCLVPVLKRHPEIEKMNLLERLCEPERQILFQVPWEDDAGKIRVNRGYRIEFNSALGPYKGGLRFHPGANAGTFKFLGFEQVLKNSLTGLMLGGGKGGADFDPKGKSDSEIMRFCRSFMIGLHRHIGDQTDIPAGDMGVSPREIGFLFGAYKRLVNRYEPGAITGKGLGLGGSQVRKEATGYGVAYFAREILNTRGDDFEHKTCVVSGSGNVALYAIKKLQEFGANVVACSDSSGMIHDEEGLDFEALRLIKEIERDRLSRYPEIHGRAEYHEKKSVWDLKCDLAFPCAIQNEIDEEKAGKLVENGCQMVCEGANMPCTPGAFKVFQENEVILAPSKAANAGGVAISGLEIQQNAMWTQWTFKDVDDQLRHVMKRIHQSCLYYSRKYVHTENYIRGADIGGFIRVAEAMQELGVN